MSGRILSADEVGLPIIEALGLGRGVIAVELTIEVNQAPTLTVRRYVLGEDWRPAFDGEKLREALARYRLVLIDG